MSNEYNANNAMKNMPRYSRGLRTRKEETSWDKPLGVALAVTIGLTLAAVLVKTLCM